MGLFKSSDERRLEREMEIRKGLARIKKQIRVQERDEKEFICIGYDLWRRQEVISGLRGYTKTAEFRRDVKKVAAVEGEDIYEAMQSLGEHAGVRDMMRARDDVPEGVRTALSNLQMGTCIYEQCTTATPQYNG